MLNSHRRIAVTGGSRILMVIAIKRIGDDASNLGGNAVTAIFLVRSSRREEGIVFFCTAIARQTGCCYAGVGDCSKLISRSRFILISVTMLLVHRLTYLSCAAVPGDMDKAPGTDQAIFAVDRWARTTGCCQ